MGIGEVFAACRSKSINAAGCMLCGIAIMPIRSRAVGGASSVAVLSGLAIVLWQ